MLRAYLATLRLHCNCITMCLCLHKMLLLRELQFYHICEPLFYIMYSIVYSPKPDVNFDTLK